MSFWKFRFFIIFIVFCSFPTLFLTCPLFDLTQDSLKENYLKVISSYSFPALQLVRSQLFDFCKSQKNDDFLLELIRLRGIFSKIPSGSDSTDILHKLLFCENPEVFKIFTGEPVSNPERQFWAVFYGELMLERKNKY